MRNDYTKSEFIMTRGKQCCQECGHRWSDLGPLHYPDCRFAYVEESEEEDVFPLRIDVQLELSFRKAS